MRSPEEALAWARQRFSNQKRRWLDELGQWPLELSLERPSEQDALQQPEAVRQWSHAWAQWSSGRSPRTESAGITLGTLTVAWRRMGEQTLPDRLSFASSAAVAEFVGERATWTRVIDRRQTLCGRWPQLKDAGLGTHFEVLATWAEADFERLVSLLSWFEQNPRSGLLLRQLPVSGIDTKWIDLHRRGVVADMLRRLRCGAAAAADQEGVQGEPVEALDFYKLCGLRRPAPRVRVLVLCPELRRASGGMRDIEAPLDQLQQLAIRPRKALMVENQETAYSLPDFEGTVALVKLGNAVSLSAQLPWMSALPVVYWGDLDSHGMAILAQARKTLGSVTSILMDEETLLGNRDRWVQEPSLNRSAAVASLTDAERWVYLGLVERRWGERVRLEQERIEWPTALAVVADALKRADHPT